MTTIAYTCGIMAADRQVTVGDNTTVTIASSKIARDANGVLYGVAGAWGKCCAVLEAVSLQARTGGEVHLPIPTKDDNDYEILIAYPDGRIRHLSHGTECIFDGMGYYAIGGGSEAALGAMFAGSSAIVAVEAACLHSSGSRGPVDCMTVGGWPIADDEPALTPDQVATEAVYNEMVNHGTSRMDHFDAAPISKMAAVLYHPDEEAETAFDRIARQSEI